MLHFSRICNWLNPFDVAAALLPFEAEDAQGLLRCERYETGNDTLTLYFARPLEHPRRAARRLACQPRPVHAMRLYAYAHAFVLQSAH